MLRPVSDNVVVKVEPPNMKYGTLHLPTGDRILFGRVVSVGPGRMTKNGQHRIPIGVEPGERIAFFREHLVTWQGKQLRRVLQELGEDLAILRSIDILFAVQDGADVTFY